MSVDVELYGRFGWCMFGRFGWCMFSRFGLKIMEEPAPGFPYMRGSIGSSLGPPAVHMTPPCTKRPPKVHPAQAKAKPVKNRCSHQWLRSGANHHHQFKAWGI